MCSLMVLWVSRSDLVCFSSTFKASILACSLATFSSRTFLGTDCARSASSFLHFRTSLFTSLVICSALLLKPKALHFYVIERTISEYIYWAGSNQFDLFVLNCFSNRNQHLLREP